MHYPSLRLSKFGQIKLETVRGPLMLKSSLIILFCKTDADFHQIATFILKLAVYSRHTVAFFGPYLFM